MWKEIFTKWQSGCTYTYPYRGDTLWMFSLREEVCSQKESSKTSTLTTVSCGKPYQYIVCEKQCHCRVIRDNSKYGLSQWGTTLQCHTVFHWLSLLYPNWSLDNLVMQLIIHSGDKTIYVSNACGKNWTSSTFQRKVVQDCAAIPEKCLPISSWVVNKAQSPAILQLQLPVCASALMCRCMGSHLFGK